MYRWCVFVTCLLMASASMAQPRPKIGLALGGGGAKGAAHVGVLKVLEQHNIPIDYVAGTSMGAYVAAMYGLGLSADEIETLMLSTPWNQGFSDRIERQRLSYRKKQQRDDFTIDSDIGFNGKEFALPYGFIQGESMAKLLRLSTKSVANFKHFDHMPIPYRAVALDLEKMEPYVLTKGNLVTAMQASMSVPGALKPTEVDGRFLADGGIVNNLPVDVLKEMGADIVIAVDIGSSLSNKEDLDSYIAILDQLSSYMTRSSTQQQIALMTEQDILIRPEIDAIGTGAFEDMPKALPLGEAAANAHLTKLTKLGLSDTDYQAYLTRKQTRRAGFSSTVDGIIVDRVQIESNSKLADSSIEALLGIKAGKLYQQEQLEEDIKDLYALDIFQRVDYEILTFKDETVLKVIADEKSWGPGYFDFSFGLEQLGRDSEVTIGAAYTLTDLNSWGAEWRSEALVGTRSRLFTEFYTPLGDLQQFYWNIGGEFNQQERNFFVNSEDSTAVQFFKTDYTTYTGLTSLGWNIRSNAIVSAGWSYEYGEVDVIGTSYKEDFTVYGPFFFVGIDTLDDVNFPTLGQQLDLNVLYAFQSSQGMDDEAVSYDIDWRGVKSWGRHTGIIRLNYGGIDSDLLVPAVVKDLGGYQNLSGLSQYELSGNYKTFASLVYNYRMLDNDFGAFKLPMYLSMSIEQGNTWQSSSDIKLEDMITAGSIGLAVNSNIGPITLAAGLSEGGNSAVYLYLGTPFL